MSAKLLKQPAGIAGDDLVDWGPVAKPLGETVSHTSGRLLHRDEDGGNEAGLWVCTPGVWRCEVERDEFCHFLGGRCVYTDDEGQRLEIEGGWSGTCEVLETVRKTYLIP